MDEPRLTRSEQIQNAHKMFGFGTPLRSSSRPSASIDVGTAVEICLNKGSKFPSSFRQERQRAKVDQTNEMEDIGACMYEKDAGVLLVLMCMLYRC